MYGEVVDVELFLLPKSMSAGAYEVTVTRKGSNLYQLLEANIWLKTRYCYEYVNYDDAILKVSGYGYSKGKIVFDL